MGLLTVRSQTLAALSLGLVAFCHPLAADIVERACRAAAHDLRFAPLRPEELPGLRVIVSVLDPPEPVLYLRLRAVRFIEPEG